MCGHVFLYQDRYRLQQHRPVWQCGTCGRVSHVPLDCCTRPEVARQHPVVLAQRLGQWSQWVRTLDAGKLASAVALAASPNSTVLTISRVARGLKTLLQRV